MATVERFPSQPLGNVTLPFSEAVRVGDVLFLSGNLGHYPGKLELVPGGIAAETRQALENLGAVLQRRGLGFGDVVKVTCMLADMSEWQAMNAAYTAFFAKDELPARSAFGTSGLALGARIELEAIAAIRG
jgi:reactive intermediate/imine deaminase